MLQARDVWHEDYSAREPMLTAWTMIGLGFLVEWAAEANWAEILFRPVVLGLMLWMARSIYGPSRPRGHWPVTRQSLHSVGIRPECARKTSGVPADAISWQ